MTATNSHTSPATPACDAAVVGGGAAGLNAALVLARARRRVVVIDAGEPRNAAAEHAHGFLSRDGTPPQEILRTGREEIARYGAELVEARVERVEPHAPEGYALHAGGRVLTARHVVVASGLRDELPDVPGVRERWARDVLHCPYCHGYEVRDQPLGVLGTGPLSVGQALLVRQWSDDVVFFPHALEPTAEELERLAARGVHVVEGAVARLAVEDDRLRAVELADGRAVARAALLVFPRPVPGDELLTALGCEQDGGGWVVTDPAGRTSVAGVWAVGNVADPRALLVTAAGAGAAAAFALNHDLVDAEVAAAVAQRAPSGSG